VLSLATSTPPFLCITSNTVLCSAVVDQLNGVMYEGQELAMSVVRA
jgi:hypothetical protein